MIKGKWKGKKRDFHFRNEGENMTDKRKQNSESLWWNEIEKKDILKEKKDIWNEKKKKLMQKRYRKKRCWLSGPLLQ